MKNYLKFLNIYFKKNIIYKIYHSSKKQLQLLNVLIGLLIISCDSAPLKNVDNRNLNYGYMKASSTTMLRWTDEYRALSKITLKNETKISSMTSLPDQYFLPPMSFPFGTPSIWNQGQCGNCWIWASSVALNYITNPVINSNSSQLKAPFNIQFFDSVFSFLFSCQPFSKYPNFCGACAGGGPEQFTSMLNDSYFPNENNNKPVLRWTEPLPNYEDGDPKKCSVHDPLPNGTLCPDNICPITGTCGRTKTYPVIHYNDFKSKVNTQNIIYLEGRFGTIGIAEELTQDNAITIMENLLTNNIPVLLQMNLTKDFYSDFGDFFQNQSDNAIFDPSKYCGQTNTAGGHVVVIIGYDKMNDYWLVQNSWGTTNLRPLGQFRLKRTLTHNPYSTPDPCQINLDGGSIPLYFITALNYDFIPPI